MLNIHAEYQGSVFLKPLSVRVTFHIDDGTSEFGTDGASNAQPTCQEPEAAKYIPFVTEYSTLGLGSGLDPEPTLSISGCPRDDILE